ncbi:MAG: TIGR00270 family protein [Candidatus Aenigmarchaeota archaeon]|nr:TIGR00270 family protein [Candidatus Aenigmarchaeota archaeon]
MTDCEICGRKATKKAIIDGVLLDVCDECAKLGEVVNETVQIKPKKRKVEISDNSKYIDPRCPQIVKREREKLGLTRKELAEKLKERESVIARIERGELTPTMDLAKKLERFFGVKLIMEYTEESFSGRQEGDTLTIGDIAEVKVKK